MQRLLSSSARWLVPALLLFLCSSTNAKELKIEKFDAQIAVLPDSTVNVTESIIVHFIGGPWHRLYRQITVEDEKPPTMKYSLFFSITRVSHGAGHHLKFDSSHPHHYPKLK